MIEQILYDNGFSKKEARLYLTVLALGEATFSQVAKKATLQRSTVYGLIDAMKEKGLLSILRKRGINHVSALSPKLLIAKFDDAAQRAHNALPQLIEFAYASPVKPRIYFYDGVDGIKQILIEAAATKKDYIGFIDYELMPPEVYVYIRKKVAPERRKHGNTLKLIMPDNPVNVKIQNEYQEQVTHKTIPFPTRKNHVEILLYGDSKIGCMSFLKNEMFGVVIQSEGIFQTLSDLFNYVWESKS